MTRNWTWEDYAVIRNNYPVEGVRISKRFPGSTLDTIRSRALRVNTSAPTPFTPEEIELAERFGSTLGTALIFLMPERAPVEISQLLQLGH